MAESVHPQSITIESGDGRTFVMDSMTYADGSYGSNDLMIAASYFGSMPVCHWILPVRPKGVIAQVNATAERPNIEPGMRVNAAAALMLRAVKVASGSVEAGLAVHEGAGSRIVALGSTLFICDAYVGDVICAGSAFSEPFVDYAAPFAIRGLIFKTLGAERMIPAFRAWLSWRPNPCLPLRSLPQVLKLATASGSIMTASFQL